MSDLLEHILNGDYVSANELFEERMVELQEKKLYEEKRMVAAQMDEVHGGKLPSEVRASPQYRGRASDILGDPTASRKGKRPSTAKKPTSKSSEEPQDVPPSRGLKRAIKLGAKRTATRLAVGTGKVLGRGLGAAGRGLDVAKSAPGKIKQGVEKFVSDPLASLEKKKQTVKVKRKAVPDSSQTTGSNKTSKGGTVGKIARKAVQVVAGTLASAE